MGVGGWGGGGAYKRGDLPVMGTFDRLSRLSNKFWKDFCTAPNIKYTCITVILTLLHKELA